MGGKILKLVTFNRVLPIVLVLVLVLSIAQLAAASQVSSDISEYLIDYGADPLVLDSLVNGGCRVVRVFKYFDIALVKCPKSIEKLSSRRVAPNVEVVKADVELRVVGSLSELGNSSDGGYTEEWSWAISRIGAELVWKYLGRSGKDIVVAVLDTGIDISHPLLAGKLITVDPNDPKYPGGWIEFDRVGRPVCVKPQDSNGHGTWVSSIIAGGDTSTHIFGVIPNAKLMIASVIPGGYGTMAQVLAGLEWVIEPYDCYGRRVDAPRPLVVSMSLGARGDYSNVLLTAIKKLLELGIVVVAAIGNGGPHSSSNPGNVWGVIGVGAIDINDKVADFSSYEEVEWPTPPDEWPFKGSYPKRYLKPDLVAPGVRVTGAYPGSLLAIGSGTSAATPLVAGVAAIVASELKKSGLSGVKLVESVYDILTSTVVALDHPGAGRGRVRSYLAISKSMNLRTETVSLSVHPTTAQPGKEVRVTANVSVGKSVDIYVSGVNLYSGPYLPGGVVVTLPYTHGGGNTLVLVSEDGRIYGENLVFVSPAVILNTVMTSGSTVRVVATGFGIVDSVTAYIASNILFTRYTNLRGTLSDVFIAPFVDVEKKLSFVAYSGLAYTSTTILIKPPTVVKIEVVKEVVRELDIIINIKSHYVVGEVGTIEVLLPSEDYNVSLRQVYPDNAVLRVIGMTRDRKLTVFIISVTDYPPRGVAFVEVSTCYGSNCTKKQISLNVVPTDSVRLLYYTVNTLEEKIGSIGQTLSKLEAVVSEHSGSLSRVNSIVAELSRALAELENKMGVAENNLAKVSSVIINLVGALTELESRVATTENNLVGVNARIAELNKALTELENRMTAVINLKIAELSKTFEKSLSKLSEDIVRVSAQTSDHSKALAELGNRMTLAEGELARIKAMNLESRLTRFDREIDEIRKSYEELSESTARASLLVADLDRVLSSVRGQVDEISRELSRVDSSVKDISRTFERSFSKISEDLTKLDSIHLTSLIALAMSLISLVASAWRLARR
ncbi:MAG: S8 family serine peptidase [Sulfolobales archaeon]|nr:S8 family serine peptidase [Sulfolobales archaeon]MDW8082827.1 S8 family serine peptidase [Sulfolobales archaeon]